MTSIVIWVAGCIWSCRTLQGVQGRRRWIQPLLPTKWVVNYDYGAAARAARANMDQEYQRQGQVNEGVELPDLARSRPHDKDPFYPSLKARDEYDQKLLSELHEDAGFDKS